MATEKDPILELATVEDEELRSKPTEDIEKVDVDPPEDKKPQERDEEGKFKGKEEKAKADDKDKSKEKADEEKPKETVPLAKFLEERNRLRQELEQRDLTLKEFQKKLDALESKLPKPDSEPEPDFVDDPKGYVDKKLTDALKLIEQANKGVTESKETAEKTQRAQQETEIMNRFVGDLQASEARFIQEHPDYHDALAHLRQIRAFQLQQFEPNITEAQIVEVIRREEIQLAMHLARAGKDPVAVAFELAKRHGYVKKQAAPPVTNGAAPPNPKQLPPDQTLGTGAASDLKDGEEEKLDEVDQALATLFRRKAS